MIGLVSGVLFGCGDGRGDRFRKGVLFGRGDGRGDRSGKRSAIWAISKWLE